MLASDVEPAADFAIEQMLQRREVVKREIKMREIEVASIENALREFLQLQAASQLRVTGYKVTLVETTRHTIDKLRLVELQVPIATIDAATKASTSTSLRITKESTDESQ